MVYRSFIRNMLRTAREASARSAGQQHVQSIQAISCPQRLGRLEVLASVLQACVMLVMSCKTNRMQPLSCANIASTRRGRASARQTGQLRSDLSRQAYSQTMPSHSSLPRKCLPLPYARTWVNGASEELRTGLHTRAIPFVTAQTSWDVQL